MRGSGPGPNPAGPGGPGSPGGPGGPGRLFPLAGASASSRLFLCAGRKRRCLGGEGGGKWEGTIGTMETIWVTILPWWHCPQGVLVPPGGSPPKAGGKGGFWGCPQWVGVRMSPVFGDIPVALGVSPESSRCPRCPPRMSPMGLGVPKGEWGCVTVPPLPSQRLWVSILGGGGCSRPHFGAVPCPQSAPPPYSSAHGDPCPWGCPLSPECPLKLSSGRPLVPTMTPEIVPTVSPTPVATPYPLDVTYNYSQGTPYPCAPPMSPKSSSNASPFAPPPSPPPPPPTPPRLLSVPSQRDPFAAVPPPPTPSTWHCAVPSCPLTGSRSGESGREPGRPFLVGVLASLRGPCTRCRSRRSGVTHSSRRLLTGGGGGGSWGVAHRHR